MTFRGAIEAEEVGLAVEGRAEPAKMPVPDGETDLQLRMLELRHRIKNILAVVHSLVNQTLRDGVTIADARQELAERLLAVGHAVDLLLSGEWEGTTLRALIASAMTMGEARLRLTGPEVEIGPGAAMMLSILFHELECNAVKYGALSNPGGHVTVSWQVEGPGAEQVRLLWEETGGPSYAAPASNGFGSKLISRIAGRLDAASEADFRPDGLRWEFRAPLASLSS